MPHSISNIKSQRRSEKRQFINVARRSRVRTCIKTFLRFLEESDKEKAVSQFRLIQKEIDKATRKGCINKITAARKKSRLYKRFQKLNI